MTVTIQEILDFLKECRIEKQVREIKEAKEVLE